MSDIAKTACGSFFKYMTGEETENLDATLYPERYLPEHLRPKGLPVAQMTPGLLVKPKFRWTYSEVDENGEIVLPESFVKVAARPNLVLQEQEIRFGNAKTWIPGKANWESINITYSRIDENHPIVERINNLPIGVHEIQKNKGILKLYDGRGELLEKWELDGTLIESANWINDYANYNDIDVKVQLRYDNATYIHRNGTRIGN